MINGMKTFICEVDFSVDHYHLQSKLPNNWFISRSLPPPGATQPIVGVYFTALYWALASSRTRLLDHTQRRATVGRTPLNE